MRVRAGFVSNSSSTSFLIITEGEFTLERFLKLVGLQPDSPLKNVFTTLYESLIDYPWSEVDFAQDNSDAALKGFFKHQRMSISDRMREKIEEARQSGLKVMYGELSSDNNLIESFFCTDSFELESDGIYVNALEAVW